MDKKERKIILFFRIIIISIAGLFFLWILNNHLIFFGSINTVNDFSKKNPFIPYLQGNVSPPLKDLITKKTYQQLRAISAYSNLYIPSDTEKIDLRISTSSPESVVIFGYKNQARQNEEIVAQHNLLANLYWPIKNIDGYTVLYQSKSQEPEKIADLFAQNQERLGIYKCDEIKNQIITKKINLVFNDQKYWIDLDLPLRSNHNLEVYVGDDGILDLDIKYRQKINSEDTGKHGFGAYLELNDEEKEYFNDSQEEEATIEIKEENLPVGKYILKFDHNNDLTFQEIKTHNIFTILDRIKLLNADQTGNFYVNANNINITTVHSSGEQEIDINGDKYALKKSQKISYESTEKNNIIELQAEKADFEAYSYDSGVKFFPAAFSLELYNTISYQDISEEQLIDYQDNVAKKNNKAKKLKQYDYIIFKATDDFAKALANKEVLTNADVKMSLDANNLYIKDNKADINFTFSNPGVQIVEIEATYYRSFWKYLKNYFTKSK